MVRPHRSSQNHGTSSSPFESTTPRSLTAKALKKRWLGDDFGGLQGKTRVKNFRVGITFGLGQPETKVVHETLPTKVLDDTFDSQEIPRRKNLPFPQLVSLPRISGCHRQYQWRSFKLTLLFSFLLKTIFGCFHINRGKTPKMDGENNGKPYLLMDNLGGTPTIFGNIHKNNPSGSAGPPTSRYLENCRT